MYIILTLVLTLSGLHSPSISYSNQFSDSSKNISSVYYLANESYLQTNFYHTIAKPQIQDWEVKVLAYEKAENEAREEKIRQEEQKVRQAEQLRMQGIKIAQETAQAKQAEKVINPVSSSNSINLVESINYWCQVYGCDPNQLIRIMYCESGGRIGAINGIYKGIFQHDESYWNARANRYGVPGADIFDPEAQIRVTAQMFARGMANHWGCK